MTILPVTDVDRSIAFYQRLGFTVAKRLELDEGTTGWAWIDNGAAAFMLAHAEDQPSPNPQHQFYLYGANTLAMWRELTAAGVSCGVIESPYHAPHGEFRVDDPDGYVLMFSGDEN